MTASSWLKVLDETIGICDAHGRPDLASALRRRRVRLLDPHLRVVVVGEAKQGKSQLVNALVNAPVCPVGDDVPPTAPTVVQHAASPAAFLVARPSEPGAPTTRTPVPVDRVARESAARAGLLRVEVGVPRGLLAGGLSFVDTPPVGEGGGARGDETLAALADADAVVVVSDATAELSPAALDLVRRVAASCPAVLCVLTKIDLVPGWRDVLERNRSLLASAGLAAPQFPVSATLRLRAADTGDRALNAESGFPALLCHLQREVLARRDQLARHVVATSVAAVLEPLVVRARADLERPRRAAPAATRLEEAQRQLDELRRRSTRCHQILADEMADLASDMDYDLRERTRTVLREVDRILDDADPLVVWETVEDWLGRNLSEVAEASATWLAERCRWIAEKAAAVLPVPGAEAGAGTVSALGVAPDELSSVDMPRIERFTVAQKTFIGLKSSYGGVLMFGLVTSLAGLPLINPVSLGAGAVFAGKSVRDESRSRLQRRQALAKAAVQRHVDDFFLRFGKDCRDAARHVHRALRDHFTAVAEEVQERVVESARLAREAATAEALDRERRTRELERLLTLRRRASALAVAGHGKPLEITA
ncbi:Dynamin family protein [Streptoalloteichus tenebrarius]|uniref:Dynamin family protein n=1 Tax=Streptoalloteichus tenebrarius (strain ATCC 17920 / DSM 40477 / JCM 4838 / CBS 697.72 / NBRC 16177 / NCIMB 11028 / NRRL B-12390 / A12253. 1 / ISP 5477) TaxID=1933 RepID=A0ABT1I3U8_STRSD|nr:dynamin family protein [Streptoalloteichus tenebrarius]MCP2262429.1 Dynamin family protein [Streptoalloteichus tenebrarius]BFF00787.1 isoniazid inducible protein IniA [Streptoalloteichus tenebrarius]